MITIVTIGNTFDNRIVNSAITIESNSNISPIHTTYTNVWSYIVELLSILP